MTSTSRKRSALMKELLPGLNEMFGLEYEGFRLGAWAHDEMYCDWMSQGWDGKMAACVRNR